MFNFLNNKNSSTPLTDLKNTFHIASTFPKRKKKFLSIYLSVMFMPECLGDG